MKNKGFTSSVILILIMFITVPALLANVGVPLESFLEKLLQQPDTIPTEQEVSDPTPLEIDIVPNSIPEEEKQLDSTLSSLQQDIEDATVPALSEEQPFRSTIIPKILEAPVSSTQEAEIITVTIVPTPFEVISTTTREMDNRAVPILPMTQEAESVNPTDSIISVTPEDTDTQEEINSPSSTIIPLALSQISPSQAEAIADLATATHSSNDQYCAQKAKYITPPGDLPIIVEWSVDATDNVTSIEWVFHDGTRSNARTVQFTYNGEGIFPVTLTCQGPFGELQVNGSVDIKSDTTTSGQIITVTPSNTATTKPTFTPTPSITDGPSPTSRPTNTPRPTITDGPSPTPRPTRTSAPTQTPMPSITDGPSPTATAILSCEIDVVAGADNPATFQFTVVDPGIENTFVWVIEGTTRQGRTVSVTFTELGVKKIDLYCDNGTDQILRTIYFEVKVSSTLNVGDDTISGSSTPTLTRTLTVTATQTSVPPTRRNIATATLTPTMNAPTIVPFVTFTPTSVMLTPTVIFIPTSLIGPSTTLATPSPEGTPIAVLSNIVPLITPSTVEAPFIRVTSDWQPIDLNQSVCIDWVVYHTNRTESWNIFRLGDLPDGLTGDVNLTRNSRKGIVSQSPSISPDSMWVVFTSNRDGNYDIYITAVTRDDIRRITSEDASSNVNPVWSPDGANIVFESDRNGRRDLYIFNLITGTLSQLTNNTGNNINAAWSPDSSRLVFQSDQSGQWQIYEVEIASLETHSLSDGMSEDYAPLYSHHGESILYRSKTSNMERSSLFILNTQNGIRSHISDPHGFAINHSWSPDDSLIAYQSDLTGINQIYIYDVQTGATRRITGDVTTVNSVPSFAPTWHCSSSETIIFTSTINSNIDLYSTILQPLDSLPINVKQQASRLTFSLAEDTHPEGLRHHPSNLAREINTQWETKFY